MDHQQLLLSLGEALTVEISVSAVVGFLWNTESSLGQEVVSWKGQVAAVQHFCSLLCAGITEIPEAGRTLCCSSQLCVQGKAFPALLLLQAGMSELTAERWDSVSAKGNVVGETRQK